MTTSSLLVPDYTYVAFDFELTGLDPLKDEPIQIGIVQFDHTCTVINQRSSLIKPKRPVQELKEIVNYLTGLSMDMFENAPTMEELLPTLKEFFTDTTIVVGHSINIDVRMLQRFLPERVPAWEVDTFVIAKSVFHFAPSYALEVLIQLLQQKEPHHKELQQVTDHHDALHDSLGSLHLFSYRLRRLTDLRHSYLILDALLQKNNGLLNRIIRRTQKPFSYVQKTLFFPPLRKPLTTNKKPVVQAPVTLPQSTLPLSRYIGHTTFFTLLASLNRNTQQYVLAFNNRSKAQLAEQLLVKLGVSYGGFYDQTVFDPDRVDAFLKQPHVDDDEVLFTMKYFSQFEQNHTLLDISSSSDYKFFSALTRQVTGTNASAIVCTHQQLRDSSHKIAPGTHVLFFDSDRRYQSFWKRKQQPFDPLHFLQQLENLAYAYKLSQDDDVRTLLQRAIEQGTLSLWIISSELDRLFMGHSDTSIELDGLKNHTRLPKTHLTIAQFDKSIEMLLTVLTPHEAAQLKNEYMKFAVCKEEQCTVRKTMYSGDKRYYTLSQVETYRNFEEMVEASGQGTFHLLSNAKRQWLLPLNVPATLPTTNGNGSWWPTVVSLTSPVSLCIMCARHTTNQFILSASKDASRAFFNECIAKKLHLNYTIIAENITWWTGKNIFQALQSKKPCLFIGSAGFYTESLAKKFAFSHLYIYHVYGAKKENIINDLLWYSK